MSPRQGATVATVAAAAVLAALLAVPPLVGLLYVAVGLVYTLAQGLRNRSLLARAMRQVAEETNAEAAPGWHPALMLFAAVLLWVLFWPFGLVWDIYDWWIAAPDYDEDEPR